MNKIIYCIAASACCLVMGCNMKTPEDYFDNLMNEGKTYAKKNNISVNWDSHTSPQ